MISNNKEFQDRTVTFTLGTLHLPISPILVPDICTDEPSFDRTGDWLNDQLKTVHKQKEENQSEKSGYFITIIFMNGVS